MFATISHSYANSCNLILILHLHDFHDSTISEHFRFLCTYKRINQDIKWMRMLVIKELVDIC